MLNFLFFFNFNYCGVFIKKKNFTAFLLLIIFFKFLKKGINNLNNFKFSIKTKKKFSSNFVLLKAPFRNKAPKHILKKMKSVFIISISYVNDSVYLHNNFIFLKNFFFKKWLYLLNFLIFPGFHLYKSLVVLEFKIKKENFKFFSKNTNNLNLLREKYFSLSKFKFKDKNNKSNIRQ